MTLLCALSETFQTFKATQHTRNDLEIFACQLSQKEGQEAQAILHVREAPSMGQWVFLSFHPEKGAPLPLFQGQITQIPDISPEGLTRLTIIARPPDDWEQRQKIWDQFKETDLYEPLLLSPSQKEDPESLTLFRPIRFFTDPRTLTIGLSDLFEGERTIHMTPFFWRDSLKWDQINSPPPGITLTLQAQWTQRTTGFMDLSKSLRNLFPGHIIHTFTAPAFKALWPQTGQSIGRSGYWVATSQLQEIDPPAGMTPFSSPFSEGFSPSVRARKRWFKGKLIVGWALQQKRVETLSLALRNHTQTPVTADPLDHTIVLQQVAPASPLPFWSPDVFYETGTRVQEDGFEYHCIASHYSRKNFQKNSTCWQSHGPLSGDLPDPSTPSFFLTKRGEKVVQRAQNVAQTFLAQKSRCVRVLFEAPFMSSPTLSVADSVTLEDPRLPGGRVTGKVTALMQSFSGETGESSLRVQLRVSVGFAITAASPSILPYTDQKPEDPYADLGTRRYTPLIQSLALLNGPDVQTEALASPDRPPLQELQTRFRMTFKRLSCTEALHHTIHATMSTPWSAPQQGNFHETTSAGL